MKPKGAKILFPTFKVFMNYLFWPMKWFPADWDNPMNCKIPDKISFKFSL